MVGKLVAIVCKVYYRSRNKTTENITKWDKIQQKSKHSWRKRKRATAVRV